MKPAFALLVGEPGIGKSRLVEGMAEAAAGRGFVVATGRCAQDDGAPPLWPWSQALDDLGRHDGRVLDVELERLLAGTQDDQGSEERQGFRAWESIAREVLTRSEAAPLLVVLEDLHWADTGSLRVLRRLIASSAPGQQLAVVLTRRPFPEPTGSLADVGEELARHHVTRLDLVGLDLDATRALVGELAGDTGADVVGQWQARSGGNPFFLIELARLGGTRPERPAGHGARRRHPTPGRTARRHQVAAAARRRPRPRVLARRAGRDRRPGRRAGRGRAHPGTRGRAGPRARTRAGRVRPRADADAVAATTTATGLARQHARVAHALSDGGEVAALVAPEERVAELSRHWLAAGPSYAGRAWRAATDAAAQARRTFSWVEAEQLVAAAIEAHRRDPAGTALERIDLLLTRARDCRPNSEWDQVLPCAAEAISLARREEDLPRLAAAAQAATDNLVWTPQQWNEVLDDTIEDLRWALARTPQHDSADRCRLMLSLAMQLYFDPRARAELEALAEEGHAMATRLGDPALLWWASQTAWKALWTPKHAERRYELARQGLDAARAANDPDSEAVALVILAGSALEMADRLTFEDVAQQTERLARRRRNTYALMALQWVQLSLASMRGDLEEVSRLSADLYELRPRLNPVMEGLHVGGIHVIASMWTDRIGDLIEPFAAANEASDDDLARDFLLMALSRTDDADRLRIELETPVEHRVDNWSSTSTWCCLAEAAAVAERVDLATQMSALLEPLTGRIAISGISSVMGPMDGYLALALATEGRLEEAGAAAQRGLELSQAWELTGYDAWLLAWRTKLRI